MSERKTNASTYSDVHHGIVVLLDSARRASARSVNAIMTATHWEIGRRIVEFEQGGQDRAVYGEALLKRLSVDLTAHFGRGFSERNLEQIRLFYLAWPWSQILQTLSAKSGSALMLPPLSDSFESLGLQELPVLAQAFPLPWSAYECHP